LVVGINVKEAVSSGGDVVAWWNRQVADVVAEAATCAGSWAGRAKVPVGSVLLWLGSAGEAVPEAASSASRASGAGAPPTAKARAMLQELGLDPARVTPSGERLTVADIEAWLARNAAGRVARPGRSAAAMPTEPMPEVPGEPIELSSEAAGMLRTVQWHRDHAAAAYLELEYDPGPWAEHAARPAQAGLSPLLPLMAHRLVALARDRDQRDHRPRQALPVSARESRLHRQVGATLYLTVVQTPGDERAGSSTPWARSSGAMAHKLHPDQASARSFFSMARWNVSAIPIGKASGAECSRLLRPSGLRQV
jgi:hypothetical protein